MILFETFGLFMLLTLVGVPLVYGLLVSTAGVIFAKGLSYPLTSVFLSYIGGVEPFILIAVPLFILAGEVLSRGGVGLRIVTFATVLLGFLPGGLGISTVASSLVFGGISGSAIADTAAIGSVMTPAMIRKGYSPGFAGALMSTAGTLAVVMPPSIPMLVYAFVAGASVRDLFLAGVVPAFLFALGLMLVCAWTGIKTGCDNGHQRVPARVVGQAFLAALPALIMPVIILGGIWTGTFTPTEAAAVAVVYGLFVSMIIYRDLTVRDLPALFLKAFITSGVVMVVIGATGSLAWLITVEQVPVQLAGLVTEYAHSQWMFLFLVNIALLALGCFIEPVPALILAAPLLVPLAAAFKIDLVHFGLIMTCNLAIGLYTPPVGGTLMVGARLAGVGMGAVVRALIPQLMISVVILFLITYVPAIGLSLVRLFR
ncbi:MAG: TRAP transporter large permease [Casimicrobiaceae bacterium]